jgi:general secretion pathway protein F
MPDYTYRALTQAGEIVSGSISAPTYDEVRRRIEYLGLIPIDDDKSAPKRQKNAFFTFESKSSAEDVTVLTSDLALLLKTGARINDALELLSNDADIGRLRPTIARIKASVLSGESFANALARHPQLFSEMYVALARVGETSGSLDVILEKLAAERVHVEDVRRRLMDAVRYPAFVLAAATAVLTFFMFFVLPQFETVLKDFSAKSDSILFVFFGISKFLRSNVDLIGGGAIALLIGLWLLARRVNLKAAFLETLGRIPFARRLLDNYRATLFCRNLALLLQSGVGLAPALRILADIMGSIGKQDAWLETMDRVRHGGKLSEGLAASGALPPMAIRMLRLGEETGKLPLLSGRIADFYETKLQRSLDRITGIVGPAAIIVISIVVGGLIVSVMTALLSINQAVA